MEKCCASAWGKCGFSSELEGKNFFVPLRLYILGLEKDRRVFQNDQPFSQDFVSFSQVYITQLN